jgi:hypothetical protein
MKKNRSIFFLTLGISFGLSLLFFRWRDQSKEQQRIEIIRLKLESDLNHLLETRQPADIATVMQSNPVQQHTHVEKQLTDGSMMYESDLNAYLHTLATISTAQHLQIQALIFDEKNQIQRIVLAPQSSL